MKQTKMLHLLQLATECPKVLKVDNRQDAGADGCFEIVHYAGKGVALHPAALVP